jgi:hypothetical protein
VPPASLTDCGCCHPGQVSPTGQAVTYLQHLACHPHTQHLTPALPVLYPATNSSSAATNCPIHQTPSCSSEHTTHQATLLNPAPEAVLVCLQRPWHLAALPTQARSHPQVRQPEHTLRTGAQHSTAATQRSSRETNTCQRDERYNEHHATCCAVAEPLNRSRPQVRGLKHTLQAEESAGRLCNKLVRTYLRGVLFVPAKRAARHPGSQISIRSSVPVRLCVSAPHLAAHELFLFD